MTSPAEEHATREQLPVVLMLPADLLNVACGHPMIVTTATGDEVLVRIPTTDEYLAQYAEAVADLKAKGGTGPSRGMTRAEAEHLTRPLPEPAF